MKKCLLLALAAVLLVLLAPAGFAGSPSSRSINGTVFPDNAAYDSAGYREIVRKVQLALEEDGYYVGSHSGNFGFETRAAVRRYRRDHGLPIIGKIDREFLAALGFR